MRWLTVTALVLGASVAGAAEPEREVHFLPARNQVLLVTHSGGFMHDSIYVAEEVLKDIGRKSGLALQVTCYRFTGDPDARVKVKQKVDGKEVEKEMSALEAYSEQFRRTTGGPPVTKENCGRVNAATLKKFNVVVFFTTGNPVNKKELRDLVEWVRQGGALVGVHCATDTLYDSPYGELIGGYFNGHPWHQKIKIHVEDPAHPAAKGFKDGDEITDEIYQFRDPYSRDKLHIILSVDNKSVDVTKGARKDRDYAISWCHDVGRGRVFYTSLGHRKEIWKDPRYQEHLMGGLKWALGEEFGDATPSSKRGGAGPPPP
jgi:type 1 glutamine amidotransferase